MPIEIKELVIRTQVGAETGPQPSDGLPAERPPLPSGGPSGALDTEPLVQECVRQVLRILARQRER